MPLKSIPGSSRFSPERMVKVNLFENHRFFLDLYCLEPGQGQDPHVHQENDKIYQVLSGRVTFVDGDQEMEAGPGDVLHCPAGELHGVRNAGAERAELLVYMSPHPRLKPAG